METFMVKEHNKQIEYEKKRLAKQVSECYQWIIIIMVMICDCDCYDCYCCYYDDTHYTLLYTLLYIILID